MRALARSVTLSRGFHTISALPVHDRDKATSSSPAISEVLSVSGSLLSRVTLRLAKSGIGRVLAVEPNIHTLPEKLASTGIELVSLEAALAEANIVVVLVNHKQFTGLDKSHFNTKVLIDSSGLIA